MGKQEDLPSALRRWAHRLATQTSLHNFLLYKYVSHPAARAAVLASGILGILALPLYVSREAAVFFSHSTILLSNEWRDDGPLEYPNVTICHPLFFDKAKMEGNTRKCSVGFFHPTSATFVCSFQRHRRGGHLHAVRPQSQPRGPSALLARAARQGEGRHVRRHPGLVRGSAQSDSGGEEPDHRGAVPKSSNRVGSSHLQQKEAVAATVALSTTTA